MTIKRNDMGGAVGSKKPSSQRRPGYWALQDAKARFSELVRVAKSDGPQHVTLHGRDEIVVLSAEEFRQLRGDRSGLELVEAMKSAPHREIEIEPRRGKMPVRDVDL
jgi:prevent-host-death family protein